MNLLSAFFATLVVLCAILLVKNVWTLITHMKWVNEESLEYNEDSARRYNRMVFNLVNWSQDQKDWK